MPQLIDRRLNPRDKSLGNRQRFLRRARAQIKQAVDKAVRDRSIADAAKGGSVSIPTEGIGEPHFVFSDKGGNRERVFPGNKKFVAGDQIQKPPGGGAGGSGKDASNSGAGEDAFTFALSENEFLDILFDGLELPDLVKSSLTDVLVSDHRRAGYSTDGTTPNLNVLRTMRTSMSRRLALRRPRVDDIERLEQELAALQQGKDWLDPVDGERRDEIAADIERLKRRHRAIPYIDPIDVRYNRFAPVTTPRAKAVMFCLMDVSASMGEREKDLAKRFFILLHLFLKRKYDRVEVVFIRHTHEAGEVDEQEFFYGREFGRHCRQHRARKNDRNSPAAVPDRRLERLLRTGVRRRQFERRHRRLRRIVERSDPPDKPVLRLYRDRGIPRRRRERILHGRQGIVAGLLGAPQRQELRHEAGRGTRGHLSGVP